tara:strand:+ start:541 stop:783 length:243 start_codon:yes stop_codon:yes gene_type:complete
MDNNLILSTCVAVVYFVFKLIDSRLIQKDKRTIKMMLKDVLFVFMSTFLGGFILSKLNTKTLVGGGSENVTHAFTEEPNF